MPEMHLTQPGFTYTSCTENKGRIQKFKETADSWYIHKNELDEDCFQHDTNYGNFKDLSRLKPPGKVVCGNAFNLAINVDTNGNFLHWIRFFDKNSSGFGIKIQTMPNQILAEEWHKPIIRIFEKRKAYSSLKDLIVRYWYL